MRIEIQQQPLLQLDIVGGLARLQGKLRQEIRQQQRKIAFRIERDVGRRGMILFHRPRETDKTV